MNAIVNTFAQVNAFVAPALDSNVRNQPKVDFSTIDTGKAFLRVKDGKASIFMKIGKRNAIVLMNGKSEEGKVLKFKETNKVVPLDMGVEFKYSELSEAGKAALGTEQQRAEAKARFAVPKLPKAEKPLKPMQQLAKVMLEERGLGQYAQGVAQGAAAFSAQTQQQPTFQG